MIDLFSANKPSSFTRVIKNIQHPYAAILIFLFCILSYFYIDRPLATFMLQHIQEPTFSGIVIFTNIGDGLVYWLIVGALFLGAKCLRKTTMAEKMLFIFFNLIVTGCVCFLLKALFARYRPDAYFLQHDYGFHFLSLKAVQQSFPSGHTVTITTLMMSLALLLPRYWLLFALLMFLVSFSRVVLHQHYLSDVIMTMYLSSLFVLHLTKATQHSWFITLAK